LRLNWRLQWTNHPFRSTKLMPRSRPELQFDPVHEKIFTGLLSFKRLDDTEKTLNRLEELRREFLATGDRLGIDGCRRVALIGRKRAESLSRNARVALAKRTQKREIAHWFAIWLETPEMFVSWLALRKNSAEFKAILISEQRDADIEVDKQKSG
jgi:hypothetical protein